MRQVTGFFSASLFLVVTVLASGCSDDDGGGGGSSSSPVADETEDNAGAGPDRDYELTVPSGYDPAVAVSLVMLLHGYNSTPGQVSTYFGMEAAAERHGFVLVRPEGMIDSRGNRYWNATDACCAFDPQPYDDVAYLTRVLDEVTENYNIDPDRIYITGHSNGGFMTYRMACEIAPRIAAVASLAGASWYDTSRCTPTDTVSVLQIHGDIDDVIYYAGGYVNGVMYPSAVDTITDWADKNGCTGSLMDQPLNLDLEATIAGDETVVQAVSDCPKEGAVELWTIYGADHIPEFVDDWIEHVWTFFEAHPKL